MKQTLNQLLKHKFTGMFCCLVILGSFFSVVHAQTQVLNIKKNSGESKSIQLNSLRKITFSGSDLVLNYVAGTTENVGLSLISKLTFSPFTDLKSTLAENQLTVYPNPSTDFLMLKNLSDKITNVTIFAANGVKITTISILNGKVDIRNLHSGFYLLQAENQILKFFKI